MLDSYSCKYHRKTKADDVFTGTGFDWKSAIWKISSSVALATSFVVPQPSQQPSSKISRSSNPASKQTNQKLKKQEKQYIKMSPSWKESVFFNLYQIRYSNCSRYLLVYHSTSISHLSPSLANTKVARLSRCVMSVGRLSIIDSMVA